MVGKASGQSGAYGCGHGQICDSIVKVHPDTSVITVAPLALGKKIA
jgi:hypothetical protein